MRFSFFALKRALAVLTLGALLLAPCAHAAGAGTVYLAKLRPEAGELAAEHFVKLSAAELAVYRARDLVEWYEEDAPVCLPDTPEAGSSSPGYYEESARTLLGALSPWYADSMWHLDLIGADALFEAGFTGEGVRVGIIDSGISEHPALAGRIARGRNFADLSDDTTDNYGHGTKVAGLIAGRTEDGCIGLAPDATLVPLKCFDQKTAPVSLVCDAIYSAIDDFECDVINLSLGFTSDSLAITEAAEYAEEKGVVMVAAVGNGGGTALYYPASCPSVIGVGSLTRSGVVSSRSNHNDSVFLTAPGDQVYTTSVGGGFSTVTGTSFAVPVVTGAAAALKSARGDLTPEQLRGIFEESASDRGYPGWDSYYGFGVLNIPGCLDAMTNGMKLRLAGDEVHIENRFDHAADVLLIAAQIFESGREGQTQVIPLTLEARADAVIPLSPNTTALYLCDTDFVPLSEPITVP